MRTSVLIAICLICSLFIGGCGGDDSSSSANLDSGVTDATGADAIGADATGGDDGGAHGTFTIGGTVTGLAGTGLALKNGSETLAVAASGAFKFTTALATGATYAVTVGTQPLSPSQTCTVTNGTGTVGTANVTNVTVACTTGSFKIGGTVSGLAGTGLVLENNNGDDLPVSANGTFQFATAVASGNAFSVTVKTQPSSPSQTCTVTGGTGTVGSADVTSVTVNCSSTTFAIGGQISGLSSTVTLEDNGGDDLVVSANGSFAFATPIASGATYAVTVKTQPASPQQTCTVTAGTGTVAAAAVTSVSITCSTNTFTVGGTVSGLSGTGLVLQDNGGDNLTVSANGTFTFATPVASGVTYAVTVLSQPTVPSQTCVLTNDTGTVSSANVTNVTVVCTTNTYTIGGTVTGLAGTGLVLENNGGDDLAVAQNGSFTFVTPIASGATYAVTVSGQPGGPTQTCTVTGDTGTVGAANVTSVTVNCATNTYTIGGTVSGLAGTLVLQDNGGDNVTLTSNGSFAFATPVASGASYAVTVFTQPGVPSQTCTVTNDTGTVVAANVTNVTVACTTNMFTIGGTVSGLVGTGLVLQDNGGDSLPISANGAFTFATSIASGQTYMVTASANPTTPSQTCAITAGTGTVGSANVTNVTVTCTTNTYTIGGTATGLVGTGLVLQDNGGDSLTVSSNGSFTFAIPVASGGTYAVTAIAQPSTPSQTCVVTNGSGPVTNANITSVTVACTTNTYTVGGTIAGLAAGDNVTLQDNAGDNLGVSANGAFTFATKVASGATYDVTVLSEAGTISQNCTVNGGTGTVGAGNVTSVAINCTTNTFTIGGTISGLAGGSVVLQDNGGDNRTISANGTFAFATAITSGGTYSVTVLTNPAVPLQSCVVTNGAGTVTNANVTNVTVTCTTTTFSIGGTISGLAAGDSVVLQDNGADNLTLSTNAGFTFATKVPSGGTYSVTVQTAPSSPSQTCVVTNGSGMVTNANITNVSIVCTTNSFTIGGTVAGLAAGEKVVLQDNGGDNLTVSASGSFTFATKIVSLGTYSVTVLTPPGAPTYQICQVANASGTVTNANITNVTVTCTNLALAGSYKVESGAGWTTNPPTYTCLEACAVVFGGTANQYACSSVAGSVDHQAHESIWGIAGCAITAENFKKNTSYDCMVASCSESAYVNDNCTPGMTNYGLNYCWK